MLNVRLICDTQADDANLIESSVVDGAKIAAAMARGDAGAVYIAPLQTLSTTPTAITLLMLARWRSVGSILLLAYIMVAGFFFTNTCGGHPPQRTDTFKLVPSAQTSDVDRTQGDGYMPVRGELSLLSYLTITNL